MCVDPEYDGGGIDNISYILALSEIAKIDGSTAVILSVNNSLINWGLNKYGNDFQKEKYLKPLANGSLLGSFALSQVLMLHQLQLLQ